MTAPRKHRPAGYHIIELYVYAEREYIIRFWSLCQSFAPGNGHQSRIIELGLSECLSVKSRTSDWIWTFEGRDRILVNEIDMLHLGVGRYGRRRPKDRRCHLFVLFVIASRDFGYKILIAFRDYGSVDQVEIIPPRKLLRLLSHPPGRSALVHYPELHLAPRILPLS